MEKENILKRKLSISENRAKKLVLKMAKYGNHGITDKLECENDIEVYLHKENQSISSLVSICRNWRMPVLFFENIFEGNLYPNQNASIERVFNPTGETDLKLTGYGLHTNTYYLTQFISATKGLEEAINKVSIINIVENIIGFITSIESYLVYRTEIYNKLNPENQLLDSSEKKVSFETKISEWIPLMTNGDKLDRSTKNWNNYLKLRKFRDDNYIHIKKGGVSFSIEALRKSINLLPSGISDLLIDLHNLFNEKVPSQIIRFSIIPDLEYEKGSVDE